MRVLIIHTIYKIKGGEEIIVDNETQLLIQHGIQVKRLCFKNHSGIINSAIQFLQLPFNITSYYRVCREIKKFKPDIVHIHNWNYASSPSIIVAAVNKKIPIISSIHNFRLLCPSGTLFYDGAIFLESLKEKFPWTAIRKKVYRDSFFLTLWLSLSVFVHKKMGTWSSINFYLVNTAAIKKLFLNSGLMLSDHQLVVKGNSSPDTAFTINTRNENFVFVGRLNREKGILILIEAFARLGYEISIIGEGPLQSYVEEQAHKHKNITYKGRLSHLEVIDEIKDSTALVFPSIWYEGMPMTIVEAFSTATPVIASYIGAMEDMILNQYNGLHFKTGSVEDLIEKIEAWQSLNLETKKEYYCNARKTYEEKYAPEKNLEQLLKIYNKVIDTPATAN